jgi:hypothetical protein
MQRSHARIITVIFSTLNLRGSFFMMYLKRLAAAAGVVLLFGPASVFAQSGAAGSWQLTLQTPQGNNNVDLTLAQTGNALSGDLNSALGAVPIAGTATGDSVALTAKIEAMNLELGLNGKIVGDTIEGTVKFGDFGEVPFTGKRAAPKAAAAAPPAPTAGAGPTDLNGKWDVKIIIAGAGEFPAVATLKQDGGKVTGTINSMAGEVAVNGTMAGRALKLDFEAETPQGKLPVTLNGELGTSGITGKASIAGLGEADWTATRAANQ